MLRFGPDHGPVVIAAPALFEEGNRTRAFLVRILRLLADRGVASVLPDMPGQGESSTPTESATLFDWRNAFEAVIEKLWHERPVAGAVTIRGGAIVDTFGFLPARWQLAPIDGSDVLRELWRVRQASDRAMRGAYDPDWIFAAEEPVEIAGNRLNLDLLTSLTCASPFTAEEGVPLRVVRLDTDPRPADLKLPGRPLWRASEPDVDEPLAVALADDIADWVRRCAA